MKKINMLDLCEQYLSMREEIITNLDEVMTSSQFILGGNVKDLEKNIAEMSNINHGVGVANGSDAIHIALSAAGVGDGDEVIVPSFTFFATAGAVARANATPVFVDIDPATFNIDPEKIEGAITEKTKAIIPVHLYGQMADMETIMNIARDHGLVVIEDAAQAIGATYKGKQPGELGSAATYSFFPTKNLGAFGDGGMIVTNDDDLAEKARIIRVHGSNPKYHHHVLGYNSRLDEIQAAVLSVKLPYLTKWNENRRKIANYYSEQLKVSAGEFITVPAELENRYHVYHQYTIRVEKRDELRAHLHQLGIQTMIYYPIPLHLQPVFKELGYQEGSLPETEKAAREVLSLPIYPELKREQQDYVIQKINDFHSQIKADSSAAAL